MNGLYELKYVLVSLTAVWQTLQTPMQNTDLTFLHNCTMAQMFDLSFPKCLFSIIPTVKNVARLAKTHRLNGSIKLKRLTLVRPTDVSETGFGLCYNFWQERIFRFR